MCSKIKKEFIELYNKLLKQKKIKKNLKDPINTFCNNINKNLEIVISTIKQFSNNFFKIGYFNPIHNIFIDIFRLIDTYKVEDISNIVINNVLYFILKSSQNDKKNYAPKLVSLTPGTNPLAALGFINVPSPFLKKLPPEIFFLHSIRRDFPHTALLFTIFRRNGKNIRNCYFHSGFERLC